MPTEDGRFDDGSAGPVRVADFDALDEPDESGPAVRVASFDLDDDHGPDDKGSAGGRSDGDGSDGGGLDDGRSDDDGLDDDGSDDGARGDAGPGYAWAGPDAGPRARAAAELGIDGPVADDAMASAPTAGHRTVDLDGPDDGLETGESSRLRVVSFDDASDDIGTGDTGSDGTGLDRTVRRARFDGIVSAERRGRRDGAGRRDAAGLGTDGAAADGAAADGPGADGVAAGSAQAGAGARDAGTRGAGTRGARTRGAGTRAAGSARDRRGSRGGRGGSRADAGPPVDDETRAKEICLRLLSDRARTVKELRDALLRKEIPEDVADRVLERFDEVGLVDDEAFAGQWVRSRHQHRGLGKRAIAQELRRKGVAKEVADEALSEIDAESEEARARELVAKKIRTVKVGTREERASASRRLVGMLARKGYGAGVAYSVVREAIAARGAEDDELGEEPPED